MECKRVILSLFILCIFVNQGEAYDLSTKSTSIYLKKWFNNVFSSWIPRSSSTFNNKYSPPESPIIESSIKSVEELLISSRQNVRTRWTTKPPKHHQNRRQTAKESQHGGLYSRHTNPTGHTINLSGHQRAPNPVLTFQNQGGNLISVVNWLFALANCVLLLQILMAGLILYLAVIGVAFLTVKSAFAKGQR